MDELDDDVQFRWVEQQFARRRRRESMPKSSAQLIHRVVAKRGIAHTQWNQQLQDVWGRIVDPRLRRRTRPTVIRRGSLEVVAESSVVLQQLSFLKSELLEKLQNQLPEAGIRELRFRTGRLD